MNMDNDKEHQEIDDIVFYFAPVLWGCLCETWQRQFLRQSEAIAELIWFHFLHLVPDFLQFSFASLPGLSGFYQVFTFVFFDNNKTDRK